MENILYDLWLNNLKGIGPHLIHNLLKYFTTAHNVYYASLSELKQVSQIGKQTAEIILQSKDLEKTKYLIDYCNKKNILIVPLASSLYPPILYQYPKAPTLLYMRGNPSPLCSMKCAAIVGARRCSDYGKEATIELTHNLVKQNICIISGMAKGTDSYAHTTAIQAGGYTATVLGTGPERCYPSEHIELMNRIIETGVVISQFPPNSVVHKQNFIQRNLLVALLSNQIFVMQASKNSGSLYTAECGLAYHKETFALPGNIFDPLSEGSNTLIAKGASIYLRNSFSISHSNSSCMSSSSLTPQTLEICHLLSKSPLSLDHLSQKLNLDSHEIQEILFMLELDGYIVQSGGVFRLKKSVQV